MVPSSETKGMKALITKRLKAIQSKYNFNPNQNAIQVRGLPAPIREAYASFKELVALAKEAGVPIPYSPSGVRKVTRAETVKPIQECVYLCQRKGTTEWKVGYSKRAHERINSLNTGNSGTLILRAKVPGGRSFEQRILRYLAPLKIPGKSREWVYLDPALAKEVIRKMRKGPDAFQGTV